MAQVKQEDIIGMTSEMATVVDDVLRQMTVRHADKGDAANDAAQISALMHTLTHRLARLGVSDKDAMTSFLQSLRGMRQNLANGSGGPAAKKGG